MTTQEVPYKNRIQFRLHQLRIKQKWEKSGLKISKELRDIIHGYIMSDGYVRNGVLTIDQSKKQKRFVEWLYHKLDSIRTSTPIKEVVRIHPLEREQEREPERKKPQSQSLRFYTKAILHGFHYMWYKPYVDKNNMTKYKKGLPKSVACFFNDTFITLWYAGDGTKVLGSVGAKFEVTAFTVEERLQLKSLFLRKLGISTALILSGTSTSGNSQWALKIPADQYPKFRNLITKLDLIPTVFPNKLHKNVQ